MSTFPELFFLFFHINSSHLSKSYKFSSNASGAKRYLIYLNVQSSECKTLDSKIINLMLSYCNKNT